MAFMTRSQVAVSVTSEMVSCNRKGSRKIAYSGIKNELGAFLILDDVLTNIFSRKIIRIASSIALE
jgi:hypothetical protein